MSKTILFTGAHHNSALAVLDELMENLPVENDLQIAWVGLKHNSKGLVTPEYTEVSKRSNVRFFHIVAGKLYRTTSLKYLIPMMINLLLVPIGFIYAFSILMRSRPDLIVSFGGYIGVPIVIVGKMMGIKSVIHEQTAVVGLANKITGKFVEKFYTTWPINYYVVSDEIKSKMVFSGLPIRKNLVQSDTSKPIFKFENDLPVLYVTGGKSGSDFINQITLESLDLLVEKFNIIWSCGNNVQNYNHSYISSQIEKLNPDAKSKIILKEYFFEDEMPSVFKMSNVVLTRGGAHTVYELAVLKKPAVIIPIPWSSNNEQKKNAEILVDAGLGVILDQENTNPSEFVKSLDLLISKEIVKKDVKLVRLDSSKFLSHEILQFVTQSKILN